MEEKRYGTDLVRSQLGQALKVNGVKNVDGMQFHDIEGGFGAGKKAMLVKEIANIHGKDLRVINQNIERNRKRFLDNIDIVDLKGTEFVITLSDNGIYTQNAINRSSNIYLLSERGYAKLLKILEDDVAWEQYDKLVDGYFNMRREVKKPTGAIELFELQVKALKEVEEKVETVDKKFDELPLFTADSKALKKMVNRIVVPLLGGKKSNAYKPLSKKVFSDLYGQVHREFGVSCCDEIKRKDLDFAKDIVSNYRIPTALKNEIESLNNQISFKEES
ncbi:ORF6C domain-containing protein [Clostridium sp. LY3-2]|uniref:ORF6C domain-containing protein n=1 Tax=Clostridium sp. LY3-2 TaxID=2942482 RepID=UPI0021529F67|nr:ORF6C domain-containing protein [Clostridium sp. LY3-2]MCR6515334.1 ORF6C domain-containing protein [Clostridium sp. LY3-2]